MTMQKVNNTYEIVDADETKLTIYSKKTGEHVVKVPTWAVVHLQKYSWCFEDSKQQVYTMNMSGEVAKAIFNYSTPRIYLWKFIGWIMFGCVDVIWERKDKLSYLPSNGKLYAHPLCVKNST
jgi:hypothetical protein